MLHTADTVVELLCHRVETEGSQPALGVKRHGLYQWLTWSDIAGDVAKTAAVLVELGVQRGDRVAQLSENRYEWIVLDFAVQMAGAVHVPIHAPLTGQQVAFQVRHSGAKVLFVSTPEQAGKLDRCIASEVDRDLGQRLCIVSYDSCPEVAGRTVRTLAELQASATLDKGILDKGIDASCQTRKAITADSLSTILYTSGTTGEPKGVLLTQGNLASNACATIAAFGWLPDQTRLNFLPLSHIFARTCDLYCWLVEGSKMALAEARETVIADCQAVQPTYMNGVPYFYDRVYRGLCEKGVQDIPGALKMALGGAIEKCCAGGAALPPHLYDYYHGQGVPLLEGYGLSESSPVITLSTATHHRRGSCGRAIPGIDLRIADDGEILTRGPHVMQGYYENPAATAEVLKEGWLYTGDIGHLDNDGFLFITGRKKEIIVTSAGKNIAPVYLESLLTQDPLILQAMVIGDGRSCLAALVVPNPDTLRAEIVERGITVTTPEKALQHPDVLALYRERIDQRLSCVSHHEQVRRFTLLARGFSIEAGELTPKLSLRRKEIEAHFAPQIDAMYR
jgi:long-chain acyl-CoA synthetase